MVSGINTRRLSCDVSKALDSMKYGYEDIKARAKIYKMALEKLNIGRDDIFKIIAGSKAEGVSYGEDSSSDIDIMLELNQWICCNDLRTSGPYPGKVVFEMVTESTEPGYTMLRCKNSYKDISTVEKFFITQKCYGQTFLGHLLLPSNTNVSYYTISGPAHTTNFLQNTNCNKISIPLLSVDLVFAIRCTGGICTEYLQKWKQRNRFTSWPGQQLIKEVSQMYGHVVPVGSKGSEDSHLEWRICYTEAEIKLIHSMNETQLKLYVLLRMVSKKILKPICSDISSYIMKNVLFWFVERTPADRFKPENLLALMEAALLSLTFTIEEGFLSNYMIPERNLLAGRLSEDVKGKLLAELHNLVYVQGPTFFLHQKDFQSLKSAVEQVQSSPNPTEPQRKQLSTATQQFLKDAYEKRCNKCKQFLNKIWSELTEDQIERNILDIGQFVA